MPPRIDTRALHRAHIIALVIAALFTLSSIYMFLLVAVSPFMRPERTAYGVAIGAGAVGFWLLFHMVGRAYVGPKSPPSPRR